jgi:glycosyltransferase involved in cell wall biosynthesis
LRARAETLGLGDRARFLGARSREWIIEEAPRYLALVAPFKPAPDGSRDSGPMVVKEAMAMELPVVATRFMGLKEMVTSETGFLAEPDDPASLAAAIDSAVNVTSEARANMGRKARQRMIEGFSLDVASRALSSVFEAA